MEKFYDVLIFLCNKILEQLYPPICIICGKQKKDWLCEKCEKEIKKIQKCKCEKVKNKFFENYIYVFKYEGIIRNKIIDYKFNEKSYYYKFFSKIILKNAKIYGNLKKYDIIMPVPIHKKRKKQRGYNQSALIAKEIAKKIENLKYENEILIKQKNIKPQSSLNKIQRKENVINAYKIQNVEKIINKNIIIFDDIYTSTVNECAKILKQNGANKILVLTIAKD